MMFVILAGNHCDVYRYLSNKFTSCLGGLKVAPAAGFIQDLYKAHFGVKRRSFRCQTREKVMQKEKIAEIIAQLKIVRAEKELSYQKIADMTEEIGDPVSISTVKRVFTDDKHSFRWDTIRPIATVVLGVGFETPEPDKKDPNQPQLYYSEIEALKALVEAKGEMIASKDISIDFLKKQLRRQQAATAVMSVILGIMTIIVLISH